MVGDAEPSPVQSHRMKYSYLFLFPNLNTIMNTSSSINLLQLSTALLLLHAGWLTTSLKAGQYIPNMAVAASPPHPIPTTMSTTTRLYFLHSIHSLHPLFIISLPYRPYTRFMMYSSLLCNLVMRHQVLLSSMIPMIPMHSLHNDKLAFLSFYSSTLSYCLLPDTFRPTMRDDYVITLSCMSLHGYATLH